MVAAGCGGDQARPGAELSEPAPLSPDIAPERSPQAPDSEGTSDSETGPTLIEEDPQEATPGRLPVTSDTACAETGSIATQNETILLLLIDTSGSMTTSAGPAGHRLQYTVGAVAEAMHGLPESVHVGLVSYPGRDASVPICPVGDVVVPLAQLDDESSDHRSQLDRGIQTLRATGSTPTYAALQRARETLLEFEPELLAEADRSIALITDGAPNPVREHCDFEYVEGLPTDPQTESAIVGLTEEMAGQGISTFVLGSPGSEEGRSMLSRVAEVGGTAEADCSHDGPNYCHQDMTQDDDFGAALSEALGTVTSQALTCSYPVPSEAPNGAVVDRSRVNVEFAPAGAQPESLLQDTSSDCAEGWFFSGDQVQLCSQTCERVRSSAEATLTLLFGCETRVVNEVR